VHAVSAIRRARLAAGLTQAELARLAGMTQPQIARLERPGANPRVKTLARVLRAVNAELVVKPAGPDPVDMTQISRHLAMTPGERLRAHHAAAGSIRELRQVARRVDGS
jgi:transcriptional regulator with XRE-family HTH domain